MLSERLRLFVAVDVPMEILQRVEREVAPLKEKWPQGRWSAVSNQHVTMKFLGWVPGDRFEQVRELCATVARSHAGAELSLSGLGSFPSARRMRVLWVGLDNPEGVLAGIAADLDRAFEPLGFPAEQRAFTAHLTLARFKTPVRVSEPLPRLGVGPQPFRIEEIVLYRSHLSPKGARYEVLGTFPLGG